MMIYKKKIELLDNNSKELNDKKEDENNKKLVKWLVSLLFCKDYVNCIVHGKGKLSGEKKAITLKRGHNTFYLCCFI